MESRLTNYVKSGASQMQAGYTYDGLRAWKENSSGTYRYYVYDGDQPVVELSSTGTLTALATFGANGLVCCDIGAMGAVTSHFYALDPQGRPAALVLGSMNWGMYNPGVHTCQ